VEFPELVHPIVQAPLAGGPSTPELAAAVSGAGGFGFLAGGYAPPEALRQSIARVRELTDAPFGVNLFLLAETDVDEAALAAFAARLSGPLGEPRFDDDAFEAKLALVLEARPAVVSLTFGCPWRELVDRLHERGIAVWATVTEPEEARAAQDGGADALVVQGVEAGGHRGSFDDADGRGEVGLLALLRLVAAAADLPLVAAGGIADGAGVAAVLAAGARAAQVGTAFMRTPEAATSAAHRAALAHEAPTALTRAFTGRRARGIVNRFMREHGAHAPAAFPHVQFLTAPLRAAARAADDADAINLWAGQAHALASDAPAAELVVRWSEEAREALYAATAFLPPSLAR
jgi:nitronate monooxygenase